ncbi:MAG TPA: DUF6624 domain-containing protein [Mucilaginibacter sp.]|nr:DUF6624 domain-containing protein [Mucilaginibacter sp.]
MKRITVILLLCIANIAIAQKVNITLKKQLDSVYALDQKYREIYMTPEKHAAFEKELSLTPEQANGRLNFLMMKVDSANIIFIEAVFKKYGYPGKAMVGEPTNEAAWNVVQHSAKIHQYIPMMKKAANEGELPFRLYAMMLDRDLMEDNQEQIYGSQVTCRKIKNGERTCFVWPIKDAENVNERRKKAGFDLPIKEYAKKLGVDYRVVKIDEVR